MKIKEAQVYQWLDQVQAGDISFSRMVELINEEKEKPGLKVFSKEHSACPSCKSGALFRKLFKSGLTPIYMLKCNFCYYYEIIE